MKKLLVMGLAAMGLALTACNSDETVEVAKGKAINFASFVDKSTRGAADDVTIANLKSIEVYGWRGDAQIFNKQQVKVAENGEGTYSPLQYWEANYAYAFEAIAPKAGEKGVQFEAAKAGGKITFENNATTDLLYANTTATMPEKSQLLQKRLTSHSSISLLVLSSHSRTHSQQTLLPRFLLRT